MGKDDFVIRPLDGESEEGLAYFAAMDDSFLLGKSITTMAVEGMKVDGSEHQKLLVLEFEGRFNKTELEGSYKVVLNHDSALAVMASLYQSLSFLEKEGG